MSEQDAQQDIPTGFGKRADGVLIPKADEVQGPSDIMTQYGQDSIPEGDVEQIERNRVAGLDAKGHPISGADLSPAAQQAMAYEASLLSVPQAAVPVVVVAPSTALAAAETPSAQVSVVTHPDAAPEHVSWLHAEIEKLVAEFHHRFGGHAA